MTSDPLPIATATVARLYMEQGKLEHAEQLYRELIADEPDDLRLTQGLAEVRRRQELLRAPPSGDHVTLEPHPRGLRCRWQISEEGRGRAALVLGREGTLVLRLVAFPLRPTTPPQDTRLSGAEGEMELGAPEGARVVGAAVGLCSADGEFVSITHTRPVNTNGGRDAVPTRGG